ncbi:MAG: hypothetical protein RJQ09_07035 [Cyclobacteriaceae bacterium]
MRFNVLTIVLSIFLTFATADYVWMGLLNDEQFVAELTLEDDKKELKEGEETKTKHFDFHNDCQPSSSEVTVNLHSGYQKCGNSFEVSISGDSPSLYILYHQLRLHC